MAKEFKLRFRKLEHPVGLTIVELAGDLDYTQVKRIEEMWRKFVMLKTSMLLLIVST